MKNFIFGVAVAALIASTSYLAAQSAPRLKLGDPLPANLFSELARTMNPTVVNISTSSLANSSPRYKRGYRDPILDFFERYGGGGRMQQQPQNSLGTGFIIRKDGLILTNNHVIENADIIKVQLEENSSELYEAEVIGRDKRTDVALIKIDAKKNLPAAMLGSSKDLKVGEWVMAIGNPYGHGHTVTKGIVSAIGREINQINRFPFIQTDASINPGNSGGPLLNSKGEVIGVNTAIDARAQGIGFAIPIDEVKAILPMLEKDGLIRRGFLGVNMYPYPLSPQNAREIGLKTTEGALIVGTIEGGGAAKAGLKEYDLITKFDGKSIKSSTDLSRVIQDSKVGGKYKVEFIRNGKKKSATVRLNEHPDDRNKSRKKKKYAGQKAPFDLGFSVTDWSADLSKQLGLPRISQKAPVVIDVEVGSPAAQAGLGVGDIISDVNRSKVRKAITVLKKLKKGQINSLRVNRGGYPVLIYLNPKQ